MLPVSIMSSWEKVLRMDFPATLTFLLSLLPKHLRCLFSLSQDWGQGDGKSDPPKSQRRGSSTVDGGLLPLLFNCKMGEGEQDKQAQSHA